jgi:serine/threonine protein kinase
MGGLEVGDRLAGYELLELVGEGRTGDVYRALQPRLERIVAVKVVRPELAADADFRERFRRETGIAASIDHPNVIPVYEVGEADGALFTAMRWVDGPDLGRLLAERGRLDPAQALRVLGRVAAALEAAHGAGLHHRDLRPTNVLLEGDRVYLTGFGLAAGDSHTDVHGLGRLLEAMLDGSVPAALEPVLRRAMSPDPADGHLTPTRFVEAVEGALEGSEVGERPERRRRHRLLAIGAAAVLVVAVVVAVILAAGGGSGDAGGADAKTSAKAKPTGGRTLPAAATLPPCGKTFSGPPRDCRSKTGGYEALTDLGKPLHLATMNFTVDRVREAAELRGSDGSTFSAPKGIRFVVIDATITNLTGTAQKFEPNNLTLAGRETALWLFGDDEKIAPYRGPEGDDYSVQYDTVVGSLQTPLSGVNLFPHIPYSGQLVFHYPATTLDADRRAVLEVHELGHGFRYARSLGGVRLHL